MVNNHPWRHRFVKISDSALVNPTRHPVYFPRAPHVGYVPTVSAAVHANWPRYLRTAASCTFTNRLGLSLVYFARSPGWSMSSFS